MTEIPNINPETAAHNIATLFSEQYIKSFKKTINFSADNADVPKLAYDAAELYALAYDKAYEYFSGANAISNS